MNYCHRRFKAYWLNAALCFVLLALIVQLEPVSPRGAAQTSEQPSTTNEINGADEAFVEANRLRREQTKDSNLRAVSTFKEAAELYRSQKQYEKAASSLRNAGELLEVLGDAHTAILLYNESLELAQQAGSRGEEGRVRAALGFMQFIVGNTDEAYKQGVKSLEIGESIGDRPLIALGLNTIGEAYYNLGNLTKALEYQNKSLNLARDLGDRKQEIRCLVALGHYYANLAEPKRSLEFFDLAVALSRQTQDIRGEGLALVGKSFVTMKTREPQETLDILNEARPRVERVGDRTSLATLVGRMGIVYFDMGDRERALDFVKQGKRLFEEGSEKWGVAEGLIVLGRIHHAFGEDQVALNHLKEAVEVFKSLSMPRLEAQTLVDVGRVYTSLGENVKALEAYQQSLKLLKRGQDQQYEAYSLNYIGNSFEKKTDYKTALEYYERALPLSRVSADQVVVILTLHNIAHVERLLGHLDSARQQIEESIALSESLRTKVTSQDLRATYFATVHQNYELYTDILLSLHAERPSEGLDAIAFAASEKARARSFLETLQESRANIREGVDPALIEKERDLEAELNLKAERQLKLLASHEKDEAEKLGSEIAALTNEYSVVRDKIKSASPRYAALTSPQPLNLEQVQQQLLNDETDLLAYTLGDDRSYAWLVTRTTLSTFALPSRKEIEDSARRLYKIFVEHQVVPGESSSDTIARQSKLKNELPLETALLSKLLLAPLAGKLGNKRLLIIPDGALQYIPFRALHDPDSDGQVAQFLLNKHEIVLEPSASSLAVLLKEARERKAAANSVAVIADPVFEVGDPRVKRALKQSTPESAESMQVKQALRDIGISADGVQVPRLFSSGEEADAIMKLAPWGTGLKAVGFEANRQRVLGQELSGYRVVHFATHGLINDQHPELSGIVLSLFDSEGRSQDGFLRLHDIYNLRLPADLVVLSACSTGLGKDVRGEGMIGLTRGFMYAGASGVIASLWKVDDVATAELMKRFYVCLFGKGLTPAAALREAQLGMSREPRWQSPYYWAGFVIQGRYDSEVSGSQFSYLTVQRFSIIVSIFVGLVTLAVLIFRVLKGHRRHQVI